MRDHIDEDPSQPQDQADAEPPQTALRAGGRRLAHMCLGVLAVLALAALVTVILTATGGGSRRLQQAGAQGATPAQQVNALLAEIPQTGNALGSPTAPVTLQFYGDLECPTSRAFTLIDLPPIINRWVRNGRLRIEYRSLQTATRQAAVFMAQQAAALAAGAQDKGWYYIELFYHEQGKEDSGYVTSAFLDRLAEQTPGLNVALWSKDREQPPFATRVANNEQTAARLGLDTTPALLVGRTGANDAHTAPRFFLREPAPLYAAIEGVLLQASGAHSTAVVASTGTGRRSFVDWTGSASDKQAESAAC